MSVADLSEVLDDIARLRVLIVGDVILDHYIHGTADAVCREAPVPAVAVHTRTSQCGGAANVAVNVRALGAEPLLISAVGADWAGRQLGGALRRVDVATDPWLVQAPERATVVKRRVVAADQVVLRLDEGTIDHVSADTERTLLGLIDHAADADALIVSDYGYGVLSPRLIDALTAYRGRLRVVVVDSRNLTIFAGLRPTAVKPNYAEAVRALVLPRTKDNARHDRVAQIHAHGERLLALTGAQMVAVTLDSDGAILLESGRPPVRTYADCGSGSGSIGAGDTFTAALALALAAGADSGAAAELAAAAAATVVGRPGTVACRAIDLRYRLGGQKVLEAGHLPRWLLNRIKPEPTVVFTNGCFDILHGGHISYLSRAKQLGDLLVVAVNSDDSVRRLKGADRPVNSLAERMRLLAALSCVDFVVPFDTDSPTGLIEALCPEAYVKGADHTYSSLPEAPLVERLGGVVHLLPTVAGRSTTGIINRIKGSGGTP